MSSILNRSLLLLALSIIVAIIAVVFVIVRSRPGGVTAVAEVKIGERVYQAEVAHTALRQARGLSHRDSLSANTGMLFPFVSPGRYPFWMKGMRFPLDFIWIADAKVIQIIEQVAPDLGLTPNIYKPEAPVTAVFELNAGTVAKDGLRVGDDVTIQYH